MSLDTVSAGSADSGAGSGAGSSATGDPSAAAYSAWKELVENFTELFSGFDVEAFALSLSAGETAADSIARR
ncbi:MAG: hypothetical protein EBU46_16635, partial [Nitrosomonadaceae bacterium]|nr:hypothetical protein [Nitrosomonadaceae bacterium]